MKASFSVALVSLAGIAMQVAAQKQPDKPVQAPIEDPLLGAERSQGCFKSAGTLEEGYSGEKVSRGYCHVNGGCPKDVLVFATKGSSCYCGNEYPPLSHRVDDKNCDFKCPGFGNEVCGAIDSGNGSFYSVYNNGVQVDVKYSPEPSSTSGGGLSPTGESPSNSDGSNSGDKKSGTNVGGIVAGVVVGVVAIAAIVGGIFFYMRRKRNQEIEEEHRRNAAVSAFVGGKPPSSSGGLSISDSRLDPVMAQRRLSDGSIADNQDYSRKILRVTNA